MSTTLDPIPTPSSQQSYQACFKTPDHLISLQPGKLRVIKRDGSVVPYDQEKIIIAMTKAFLAIEGNQAPASNRIHEVVQALANTITRNFIRRWENGGTIHIEAIQDQVELALMHADKTHHVANGPQVAKAFIIYRNEHQKLRAIALEKKKSRQTGPQLHITLDDKSSVPIDQLNLSDIVTTACQGLEGVEAQVILKNTERNLFDGVLIDDLYQALIMSARNLIEIEPNYTHAAARLLLKRTTTEALSFLGMEAAITPDNIGKYYIEYLKSFIAKGVSLELLDPALQAFNLNKLGKALVNSRNYQFTYLGLRTLYDRYFIQHEEIRFELPQIFFMRVAMGLSLQEPSDQRDDRAIEFYHLLSSLDYMSSTPTLFNAGTLRPQLSSCYISTFPDDLAGIFKGIKDNALLSKFAGGLGNSLTSLRGMGAHIKGTNGKSLGVIPFLFIINAVAIAVNQGGKRKGAVCTYLEVWHIDIEDFLELRKNTGEERRRTHDINTANWIPDLFMKRVLNNEKWTLFSPDETGDLHDLYGEAFEKAYIEYEAKAARGEIRSKQISAVKLWRKMLSLLFETGHPWITFKDPCNLRSPQQHVGIIHSSNLCTEITLNTSADEIAVCNLGSINLAQHLFEDGSINLKKLKKTITTAIRMLDNVIDINYYSVPEAKHSNLKHRPIGLGIMGFQDCLYKKSIAYDSQEAVEFADQSMEIISYYAIEASARLAKERGSYSTYQGSLWSQGILPIDSIALLAKARGEAYLRMDRSTTLDWEKLRTLVLSCGMRNSNVMAIAPTATISNICGVSQSIEPTFQNLFVKSNLSGEFTLINTYLVQALKQAGLWDEVMVNDLKYHDGSIQKIQRIPKHLKVLFKGAFEIEPRWLVECASRRQKYISQSQSLNLYMKEPSGKKLHTLYVMAWLLGLKTTYYLRTLGATHAEKSTITDGNLNAVKVNQATCSIDNPGCEACE